MKDEIKRRNDALKDQDIINNRLYRKMIDESFELDVLDDELFTERSHGKLKHSFRMGINVDNGHLLKIVFDLNKEDVAFVGSHDDTNPVADEDQERIINSINRTGYTDFVSKSKVLAIVDMDTKERLKSVTASGVMSGLQSFASKPLEEREKLAKDETSKIRGGIKYVVGQIEGADEDGNMSRFQRRSSGTYKSTRPAEKLEDLSKFQKDPLKYGRGYHKELRETAELDMDIFDELFNESFDLDIFDDELFEEKSHGKLNHDFRMGWDYNTGHQIKVVYSLDDIEITDVGDFYYKYSGKKDGATHDSHLDYTKKHIKKKGNTDHQSKGQKVLAIVDIVTGERLNKVKLVSPIALNDGDRMTRNTVQNDLESFRKKADKNPNFISNLKVNEIDNTPSFKSTHWASKVIDKSNGENLRFNKIAKAQTLKDGRGHKVDNIDAKDFPIYGDNGKYMVYHNPNKKQALHELFMREKDILNFIRNLKDNYDMNDTGVRKAYDREINNLKIVQRDIDTIEGGKYDLSMMKKYRSYNESINEYNSTIDFVIPTEFIPSEDDHMFAKNLINEFNESVDNGIIREVSDNDVINPYFVKWLLSLDDWQDVTPETLDFNKFKNTDENFVYGYFIDDKIEGIARLQNLDEDFYLLDMLFVNQDFHDNGIGSKLMKFIIDKFGNYELEVDVFEDNPRAIYLYKKFGFEIDYSVTITKDNVDPGCEHLIGKTWYGMKRKPNQIDINKEIQESMNWIDQFVHDEEFRENSYNVMIELKDPHQLMTWMRSNIRYGWKSMEDNRVHGTGESDDENYFFQHYRLQSPTQITKSKVGVCWDQCELERRWFGKNGIEHGVFYVEIQGSEDIPNHTFLVYHMHDSYWWFEHSWGNQQGIRRYDSLRDVILDVVIKQQKAWNDTTSPIYVSWLKEEPSYGITAKEYMDYAHSQYQLDVNNLPISFNESINSFYNTIDDYFQENYTMDTLPDIMYYSSRNPHDELIGNNGKLFLSPYIGISSIFMIDNMENMAKYIKDKTGSLPKSMSFNTSYDEWNLDNESLNEPLKMVHINHNIPTLKDDVFTGVSSGYIHVVDISSIKDQLSLFITNDPDREVIYTGNEPLKPIKIIPHTLNWEMRFSKENLIKHGPGFIINSDVSYKSFTESEDSTNNDPPELSDDDTADKLVSKDETNTTEEPPELDEPESLDTEKPDEDDIMEEPIEEEEPVESPKEEPKPESQPKKVDKAESSKNGVRRKKLYIAFIEWAKEYNSKNTFGSIFDKDAFNVTYPFVPDEMRYFYRLANPMLCVLAGQLTFFPVAELRKLNSKNNKLDEMMIFAATTNDLRVFNKKDKKVYRGIDENGTIKLDQELGNTFDEYIQKMINKGDILNGPIEESVEIPDIY